jgi:proteasome assembly chaperone (PAC2) family protein
MRGMKGACLLGETHGAFVDPRSTQSVLEVLGEILGIKIDLSVLEERAKEVEKMVNKLKREFERREALEGPEEKEEPWYIR